MNRTCRASLPPKVGEKSLKNPMKNISVSVERKKSWICEMKYWLFVFHDRFLLHKVREKCASVLKMPFDDGTVSAKLTLHSRDYFCSQHSRVAPSITFGVFATLRFSSGADGWIWSPCNCWLKGVTGFGSFKWFREGGVVGATGFRKIELFSSFSIALCSN